MQKFRDAGQRKRDKQHNTSSLTNFSAEVSQIKAQIINLFKLGEHDGPIK